MQTIEEYQRYTRQLEGEQEECYRGNYHTALKMLTGAKIFIKKEVG